MTLKLYEYPGSRSERVRWTIKELDLAYESLSDMDAFKSEEFRRVSPLGKLPVLIDGDKALLESAAISTWLADSNPDKGLSYLPGTWERALHDQWVSFTLTELEAYLWSSFRNLERFKEDRRVPDIINQNSWEAKKALKPFEHHLSSTEYMIGNKFTVTDIITSYTLNWSDLMGVLEEDMTHIRSYLDRMHARLHCSLKRKQ